MISPADILTHIITGRFLTERTRADHLSRVLSEVEDLVREMQAAPEAVTVERGNTAELADLEAMRDLLDGADWPPTPLGLSEVLKRADEADELDRRHAEALATISDLRAEIAALTPGPWLRLGDMAPEEGETVLMWGGVQGTPAWMQVIYSTVIQPIAADYFWRRLPAGLLTPPTDAAPTVTP